MPRPAEITYHDDCLKNECKRVKSSLIHIFSFLFLKLVDMEGSLLSSLLCPSMDGQKLIWVLKSNRLERGLKKVHTVMSVGCCGASLLTDKTAWVLEAAEGEQGDGKNRLLTANGKGETFSGVSSSAPSWWDTNICVMHAQCSDNSNSGEKKKKRKKYALRFLCEYVWKKCQ